MLVSRPVLIISRFARAEAIEHLLHRGPRLPRARWEPRDDWKEAIGRQRLQLEVGGRPNHGGPWHAAQQRNLTEPVPWTERGDQPTVSNDIDRALLDDVVAVSRITLTKQHLASRHMDRFECPRQLFDRGQWQRGAWARPGASRSLGPVFRCIGLGV